MTPEQLVELGFRAGWLSAIKNAGFEFTDKQSALNNEQCKKALEEFLEDRQDG
jgi:hypothetical protein